MKQILVNQQEIYTVFFSASLSTRARSIHQNSISILTKTLLLLDIHEARLYFVLKALDTKMVAFLNADDLTEETLRRKTSELNQTLWPSVH